MKTNPNDEKGRPDTADQTRRAARKPYVKPEVRYERVFETMALTCGKMQSHGGACNIVRKNS